MTEYNDEELKAYLERYGLIGQRFGRLTVIAFDGFRKGTSHWLCQCDCGNERVVRRHNLTSGKTRACGCLNSEQAGNPNAYKGQKGFVRVQLSDRAKQWIINHFKHTKNDEICAKYGISHTWLHRFARRHSLTKSKQFMRAAQTNAVAKSQASPNTKRSRLKKGQAIPMGGRYQFQKGCNGYAEMTSEQQAARNRKMSESMKQLFFKERARVDFGLPQKTKLKVYGGGHNRSVYRYLLKQKGYVIEGRASNDAYVTADTQRSPRMEATAIRHGMHIIINQL